MAKGQGKKRHIIGEIATDETRWKGEKQEEWMNKWFLKKCLCFFLRSQHRATEEQQLAYPMPQLKSLVLQPLCWAWSGGRSPGVGHAEPRSEIRWRKHTHQKLQIFTLHLPISRQKLRRFVSKSSTSTPETSDPRSQSAPSHHPQHPPLVECCHRWSHQGPQSQMTRRIQLKNSLWRIIYIEMIVVPKPNPGLHAWRPESTLSDKSHQHLTSPCFKRVPFKKKKRRKSFRKSCGKKSPKLHTHILPLPQQPQHSLSWPWRPSTRESSYEM